MKILILHSRYRSGWASGENSVVRDEERLLKEAGHHVVSWTPLPEPSMSSLRLGGRAVWSPDARAHLQDLMSEHSPEIVHCHNLYPMLSPAVLRASVTASASVVVTLHNYRLLCLPATCFRGDEVCELCVGHIPWRGVMYRCYRDSVLGSAAIATSLTMHRAAKSFGDVSLYLPVSRFVRDRHVEAGFDSERMVVKPNFSWPRARRRGAGTHFLYAGRLSPEKGVSTLLRAWKILRGQRLVIVGDGPDMPALKAEAPPGVEFMGTVSPEVVDELLQETRALLQPSRGNEPMGRSVTEAYAAGVPVIASNIGGLGEMIDDGITGIRVPKAEPTAWAEAIATLVDDENSVRLGEAAFERWRRDYGPARGLELLEAAYETAKRRG